MSLPAASERLREMEVSGKVRLLERGRRGVTLTEAGEALAHHARLIGQQVAALRGDLSDHVRYLRSSLRVLSNTAALSEFLPQRLAPWMAANPRIDLDLKERQSVEIARSVAAGFADIGILSDAVPREGLTLRPFASDRLVVVTAQDSQLARLRQVRLEEVVDQYLVGLLDGALHEHIVAQATASGLRLRYRLKLRSFPAICHMAGAGVGVGIVPEAAARRMKRLTRISVVSLAEDWAQRRLSVCVRTGADLSAPAQSLFAHLAQASA